jgi:hypothetical protein
VFVGLCVWLIRKAAKAARTERDLEDERLEGGLADELRAGRARAAGSRQRPNLVAVSEVEAPPPEPLAGADLRGVDPAHIALIAAMVRDRKQESGRGVEVLWVRSTATHAVWCERRPDAARELIRVARIENGAVVEQWSFV